jgi:uncharacterized membrane protein
MHKNRLEAFSDGVLAIIITIMILEIKAPVENSFVSLMPLLPVFLSYILSFAYIGIYWNNHHHIFQAVKHVNGSILWGNLFLLFWLSLIPFATSWIGSQHFSAVPMSLYGFVLFMSGFSYNILLNKILKLEGKNSVLARVTEKDNKGKISLFCYLLGIPTSFLSVWISGFLYFGVALLWIIPNKKIENEIMNN